MILQEAALNIVVTIMMMAGLPVEDQELQADIYCFTHLLMTVEFMPMKMMCFIATLFLPITERGVKYI